MKKVAVMTLCVVCSLVVFITAVFCVFNILFPFKYKQEILDSSQTNSLNKGLVASIIYAESRFNKKAKSEKGAIGLMQLLPSTAEKFYDGDVFEEELLYDPIINIETGCKFLKYLIDKYHDETTVLACYNAGEGVVRGWMDENTTTIKKSQIRYKETLNYVNKVQKYKNLYEKRF